MGKLYLPHLSVCFTLETTWWILMKFGTWSPH